MIDRAGVDTRDRGSMALELVLLAPVMVAFILLVVAGGRYVWVRGEVEAASRDAVRAATLARTPDAALTDAQAMVNAALTGRADCSPVTLGGAFAPGATITVTVQCTVSFSGLGLIGLPGSAQLISTSAAPLDVFRRSA